MNVQQDRTSNLLGPELSVAILAGGRSRRFGADKALVPICPDGTTMIELVWRAAISVADDVFIAGHARYASAMPKCRFIEDRTPDRGPLAGIQASLSFSSAPRVLVLACDQPCLSVDLLKWMAAAPFDGDVLAPQTSDGRIHPMPAVYSVRVLPDIDACLANDERSLAAFFERVTVQPIPEVELRRFDAELDSLFSANDRSQLDHAIRCSSCN